jgi:Uma2 family endonuclease
MMAAGGRTGRRNYKLNGLFFVWAEADGTGEGFDSSTGFILPNGAERSPDLAWAKKERWAALSSRQQEKFIPLCPDFVVELRSRTDRLKPLQAKMAEYIENGAQLGWLIDPYKRKVYVYRPGVPVERLDNPPTVSGESLLPGFVLPVAQLWEEL